MISVERLSFVLAEVSGALVSDFDLVAFLHDLTAHAANVSGAASVGLLLTDQHRYLHYMAASNENARLLELFQLQNEEGPCLDCFRSGSPVINSDLGQADERWPLFAPRAREFGFGSVHAFPMRVREKVIGALLQAALNARITVEQAKGALARLRGVDVDEAFHLLRDYSRTTGQRLGDVARALLEDPRAVPDLTRHPALTRR